MYVYKKGRLFILCITMLYGLVYVIYKVLLFFCRVFYGPHYISMVVVLLEGRCAVVEDRDRVGVLLHDFVGCFTQTYHTENVGLCNSLG